MKNRIPVQLVFVFLTSRIALAEEPTFRDLYPDTWVATDAIGRTMPDSTVVGPVKTDQRRVVGIFYVTWHSDRLAKFSSPYSADVTRVLAADPKARLDAMHKLWTEGMFHWGEPELGYSCSTTAPRMWMPTTKSSSIPTRTTIPEPRPIKPTHAPRARIRRGVLHRLSGGRFADWGATDVEIPHHDQRFDPPRLPGLRRPALSR